MHIGSRRNKVSCAQVRQHKDERGLWPPLAVVSLKLFLITKLRKVKTKLGQGTICWKSCILPVSNNWEEPQKWLKLKFSEQACQEIVHSYVKFWDRAVRPAREGADIHRVWLPLPACGHAMHVPGSVLRFSDDGVLLATCPLIGKPFTNDGSGIQDQGDGRSEKGPGGVLLAVQVRAVSKGLQQNSDSRSEDEVEFLWVIKGRKANIDLLSTETYTLWNSQETEWYSGVTEMMSCGSVSMRFLGTREKSYPLTVCKCFLWLFFVKTRLRPCSCSLSERCVSRVFIESSFWKDSAVRSQADEGDAGKEGRAPWASQWELLSQVAALRSHTFEDRVGAACERWERHRGARRLARKLPQPLDRARVPGQVEVWVGELWSVQMKTKCRSTGLSQKRQCQSTMKSAFPLILELFCWQCVCGSGSSCLLSHCMSVVFLFSLCFFLGYSFQRNCQWTPRSF